MNILVTGGLGFIGSHTVIELIKNKHEVIIADNLINSKIEVLDMLYAITGVKSIFYQIDVTDEAKVEEVFINHKIEGLFRDGTFQVRLLSVASFLIPHIAHNSFSGTGLFRSGF